MSYDALGLWEKNWRIKDRGSRFLDSEDKNLHILNIKHTLRNLLTTRMLSLLTVFSASHLSKNAERTWLSSTGAWMPVFSLVYETLFTSIAINRSMVEISVCNVFPRRAKEKKKKALAFMGQMIFIVKRILQTLFPH